MISNNLANFVKLVLAPDGNLSIDWNHEIIKNTCITRSGKIMNEKLNATNKSDLI
jgi:NAD/NADP transhydrogenase alpha subunit